MRAPVTKVKPAGKISGTLEGIASAFREANPQMDCRWIYDPSTKPELSGVMGRMASGYRFVEITDLPAEKFSHLGFKEGERIRVADLVLMKISREEKLELEQQNADAAKEQNNSIDRKFYKAIEDANEGVEERYRARPSGRSTIEEKELVFDYTQRDGEPSQSS